MMENKNNNILSIHLKKTSKKSILLKNFILNKISKNIDLSTINLQITLNKNVYLEITDDLINYKELKTEPVNHKIRFILHENSKLFYLLNLKPILESEYSQAILQRLNFNDIDLKKTISVDLLQQNAQAKVRVKCFAYNTQKFKFQTIQNHLSEKTSSCLCIKNVLLDNASIECNNKIRIISRAQKTFANQINHNLILGPNACITSQPQLEIEADDVECRHGVSTKTIDEENIFYMQSHGLDSISAKQMLIKSFLI